MRFAALALVLLSGTAGAQVPESSGSSLPAAFAEALRERLRDPALQGRATENLAPGRLARLLEDLQLEFQAFERGPDGELALGFDYDLAKTLSAPEEVTDASAASLDFVANGHVAFDPDANRDDYLATFVRLRWSGTHEFGAPDEARAERAERLPDPDATELAAFDPGRFSDLAARYAAAPSPSWLRDDPDFRVLSRRYFESVERTLPPELVWDFDLHAGLESDQEFSSRQVVFGSALSGRILSWDPEARLSRFNAFDLPAAALRWLAGDEPFRTSGRAYPTIVAGLDVVDAARDEARGAVTDDDSFLRARVEAGMKSPVLELDERTLYLSAGWRSFCELDAPAGVRRADLDRASHLVLSLDLGAGWALSYAAGTLPLDARYDSTFALGFRVQF